MQRGHVRHLLPEVFWSPSVGPKFLGVNWDPFTGVGPGILYVSEKEKLRIIIRLKNPSVSWCFTTHPYSKAGSEHVLLCLLWRGLEHEEQCGLTDCNLPGSGAPHTPLWVSSPERTAHTPIGSRSKEMAVFLNGCVISKAARKSAKTMLEQLPVKLNGETRKLMGNSVFGHKLLTEQK